MRVLRKGYKKKLLVLLSISVVSLPLTWLVGHSPQDGATETAQDERWFHPSLYGGDVAQQGKLLDSWRYNDLTNALDHAYRSQWVGFTNLSRVNCSQAFSPGCRNKAFPQKVDRLFPHHLIELGGDCQKLIAKFGFARYPPPSQEEKEFPLAFSVLFYKDLDQVLYLLRAIYHPHNAYCLHVDSKARIEILQAVNILVSCLPNVRLASRLEHINYAGFTRLQADIICMQDLLVSRVQWKYFLNLPGQQFPLRTNLEMVRILKVYNGSNDIEGITGTRMLKQRFLRKYEYVRDPDTGDLKEIQKGTKNSPAPHGFTVVKGSAYGTFSRAFVNYIVHNNEARDLLTWSRSVSSPDEYYWSTLHHSGRAPGGYTGKPDEKPWLSTYALWGGDKPACATQYVRGICIFSPQDLPHLFTRPEFFANKFYVTHHPAALHCLDQWLFNRTLSAHVIDLQYYKQLPFVSSVDNVSKPGPPR